LAKAKVGGRDPEAIKHAVRKTRRERDEHDRLRKTRASRAGSV
jgi:hypothetical protein